MSDKRTEQEAPECDACSNPDACEFAEWCEEYDSPLLSVADDLCTGLEGAS